MAFGVKLFVHLQDLCFDFCVIFFNDNIGGLQTGIGKDGAEWYSLFSINGVREWDDSTWRRFYTSLLFPHPMNN